MSSIKNIFKTINPEGFLIKSDINFNDIIYAIKKVIKNEVYYSQTILDLLSRHMIDNKVLDELDIQLLKEISNGAR
ncbi:hypothetical protein [Mariniflexile sp. HMF6888]|uniref:hypothetical protein n=1 Tax=Mariniflexile sp. HMF6888 TaxID=3373086 RepID=UPI0037B19F68